MIVSKTTASLCQYLRDMSNDILINIIPKLFRIIQMQDEKKKKKERKTAASNTNDVEMAALLK